MYCYRCNGTLDLGRDTCGKCGTDIRIYKKIVYASNRAYNSALVKANSRNLSGAREDLKQSLYLYKKNIMARNLLGLVEYALGEPAEALKQWVIAKNLASDNRDADRYINAMRRSSKEMDSEGHGVKKLNQALTYARNDADDLAVIQLKKVISVHPNMTKAYNLLALLYMKTQRTEQAKRVLRNCLQVDTGNVTALRYLKDIEETEAAGGARNVGTVGENEREQLIIPVRFRDYGTYLSNALYILLGLVIGLLIAWFVIVPGRVEKKTGDQEANLRSLESEIGSLQDKVNYYEASAQSTDEIVSIETTEHDPDEVTTEEPSTEAFVVESLPKKPEWITSWRLNQEAVVNCVNQYNQPDYPATINTFFTINPTLLSANNETHYRNLAALLFDSQVSQIMMRAAANQFNSNQFAAAASFYDALALLHPENAYFIYHAGRAYENLGQTELAANRYWQTAVLYPGTSEGVNSAQRYMQLTGNPELPPLPSGTEISDYTRGYTPDYFIDQITN
ncbi:MAG: hypothetical protein IK150_02320 [Lachnospiraceae bacterium]|nr:hypothetical protein [Lachnospiraceae bacterium]